MNEFIIEVYNIVGSDLCIDSEDGEKVFKVIKKAFKNEKKVILSFNNIEMMTTAFLNNAVGQLYRDFDESFIKNNISVKEMKDKDKVKLKRVNQTAKQFYKDPEKMKKTIAEVLEE